MNVTDAGEDGAVLSLSRQELALLNNALNEIVNGVHIPDWEFQTRLGQNRDAARDLLEAVHAVLEATSTDQSPGSG